MGGHVFFYILKPGIPYVGSQCAFLDPDFIYSQSVNLNPPFFEKLLKQMNAMLSGCYRLK